jgi:uncharacterized membrane protein YeaQ/YmgE (transglycosylase-associated protein family)
MGIIYWLLIGLAAGAIAKAVTPQKERTGWLSSILIGIVGSMVGGFVGRLTGLSYMMGSGLLGSLILATGGAILVLFIYHSLAARRNSARL